MAFSVKDWKNDPDQTTPLSAEALEDMEERLSDYTDAQVALSTGFTILSEETVTTGSLADGAFSNTTIALAERFLVTRVRTDIEARVRLYATATQRDADDTRAVGIEPTGNHGCILEVITNPPSDLEWELAPAAWGQNFDGDDDVAICISNLSGSTDTVQVWISGLGVII